MPIGYEARCTKCDETFCPHSPDAGPGTPCPRCNNAAVVDDDGCCIHCGVPRENDLEHYEREDGEPCGGQGVLLGSWS